MKGSRLDGEKVVEARCQVFLRVIHFISRTHVPLPPQWSNFSNFLE